MWFLFHKAQDWKLFFKISTWKLSLSAGKSWQQQASETLVKGDWIRWSRELSSGASNWIQSAFRPFLFRVYKYELRIETAHSRGLILPRLYFCEVHKHSKKERGQYLLEQARSIRNLFYEKKFYLIWGTQRAIPSGQDSTILPARVANRSTGFGWSCPLIELAIVIYHEKSMRRDNPSRYWQFSKHIGSPGLLITQLR